MCVCVGREGERGGRASQVSDGHLVYSISVMVACYVFPPCPVRLRYLKHDIGKRYKMARMSSTSISGLRARERRLLLRLFVFVVIF